MTGFGEVVQALQSRDGFLIVSHEHPDPDSVGSMLGLYFALQSLGKRCTMVSSDPVPSNVSWVGIDRIHAELPESLLSAVVVLDCRLDRIGPVAALLDPLWPVIVIDHHEGLEEPGQTSWIDTTQAATAMMIYYIVKELGVELGPAIAQPLYGGIVGDTGGFRYANTSATVLSVASSLVEQGASPASTAREIFDTKSFDFLRLLGYALSSMQRSSDRQVVWIVLSLEDFSRFHVDPKTTDQLAQYGRMVAGVEIAILFREVAKNEVRIGFRSHSRDVHRLAARFGGGGHRLASGCKINGTLDQVVATVVQAAEEQLQEGF